MRSARLKDDTAKLAGSGARAHIVIGAARHAATKPIAARPETALQ